MAVITHRQWYATPISGDSPSVQCQAKTVRQIESELPRRRSPPSPKRMRHIPKLALYIGPNTPVHRTAIHDFEHDLHSLSVFSASTQPCLRCVWQNTSRRISGILMKGCTSPNQALEMRKGVGNETKDPCTSFDGGRNISDCRLLYTSGDVLIRATDLREAAPPGCGS